MAYKDGSMRIFRKGNVRTATWVVEVDYGDGFLPYSGSLDERSARIFMRDLRRVGRKARLAPEHEVVAFPAAGREPRTSDEAISQRVLLWKLNARRDSTLPG